MNQLWIAFITGLTTGGLSCIAVQGGLLASVVLDEEKEYVESKREGKSLTIRPVILFLTAKLGAYTILGFLLGTFGSFISLSPVLRGWLQILIGIFMIGIALNILNVHPIFRYFSLQPPKSIRKFIRRQTKNSGDLGALFMGALTVLLPCAVTQAMMLLAIASGSGVTGALIMFAFILGTTPLFFILGVTTTALTDRWRAVFQRVVAIVVIFVAFFTIFTGASLAGINISLKKSDSTQCQGAQCTTEDTISKSDAVIKNGVQEITINILDTGYTPTEVKIKKGIPVKVTLKTDNTLGCARAFVVPSLNIQKTLSKNGEDSFEFTPEKTGNIAFSCSMGMYGGQFVVE